MGADPPAELVAALAQIHLFKGLEQSDLVKIAELCHERSISRDGFFFHQGEPATQIHVLHTGQVRVLQTTPDGNQVLLRFINPMDMFGGVAAFGQAEYPASAQAAQDSTAWVWDATRIRALMREIPQLALNALDHTAATIQQLQDRVRELQTERVGRRVARALLRLARQSGKRTEQGILIDHPLSRQDLAEMTGTNLYSVSRILSRWEKQGWVEAGRERVVLRIPHRLVILAEDLPPPTQDD